MATDKTDPNKTGFNNKASKLLKKSPYLLLALLITACQPPSPTDASLTATDSATVDTPLIITDDSVTMTPEHILSIKPSRYQPSLGLQGNIEPIKQIKLITAHSVNVEELLVSEGQWVEKGTALFIVRRLNAARQTTDSANAVDDLSTETDTAAQENKAVKKDSNSAEQESAPKDISKDTIKIETSANANQPIVDNDPITKNGEVNNQSQSNQNSAVNGAAHSKQHYNLVTVRASFSGRIKNLYATTGQKLDARAPILQLSDETKLHFTSTLPIQAKPQLSVGQTVNFTAENLVDKFTGQVSKLMTTTQPKTLLVYVNVIDNEVSRDNLLPDMKVTGRVNYGQIDVGTIVPKHALHDVDLTELQSPPFKPLRSLTANVWIIGQDQRLTRQPIDVIEYNPATDQYLIAGISNDSLICLADLPTDSEGKKVIVS